MSQPTVGATVRYQICFPCGTTVPTHLIYTGAGNHIAVITAESASHTCTRCEKLPDWELHLWHHMLPERFNLLTKSQQSLLDTKET